jgi:two-component sensor histidine kinase
MAAAGPKRTDADSPVISALRLSRQHLFCRQRQLSRYRYRSVGIGSPYLSNCGTIIKGRVAMALVAYLQRAVTRKDPGLVRTILWSGVCVAVPTVLRAALDPLLGQSLWFPTYYPAALIGTLFLGWQAGLVVTLLSALIANYLFVPPQYSVSLDHRVLAGTITFLLAEGLIVLTASVLRTALTRLQAAHDLEIRLNAELQHRMKNTLAIIQATVYQTSKSYSDPKEFQRALNGRITALSSAHNLLSDGRWETCDLQQLAERAFAPFQDKERIAIHGPPCELAAESCVPLVLALHELATNASKYGALSVSEGMAELTWQPVGRNVSLRWVERNGPAVSQPSRRGMGTRLLTTQKGLEAVTLEFKPRGVECKITVMQAAPDRAKVPFRPLRGDASDVSLRNPPHWLISL